MVTLPLVFVEKLIEIAELTRKTSLSIEEGSRLTKLLDEIF